MLKERVSVFRKLAISSDILICVFAALAGFLLRDRIRLRDIFPGISGGVGSYRAYLALLPVFVSAWVLFLYVFKMYESFRTRRLYTIYWIIFKAGFAAFVLFSSVVYSLKLHSVSRSLVVIVFAVAAASLMVAKTLVVLFFRAIRRKGLNYRQMLVIGTNRRAQSFISLIRSHPSWGYRIAGIIDDEEGKKGQEISGCRVLGTFKELPQVLKSTVIDEVIFIVPRSWLNRIEDILYLCESQGLKIHIAVDYFDLQFSTAHLSELEGFPLLTFESAPARVGSLLLKRFLDICFSGALLLALVPVFVLVALLVKLTSAGPVLFKQKRIGLNGRRFNLYKFRTMVKDAELRLEELRVHNEMTGPVFKMKNDPRITALGRFLRRFSIDELPQLFNVFRGDMSIVGPRPPLPSEVKDYQNHQRRRLSMRPGITCLWQVSGRNKISSFDQWVKLDLEYIDNWSLWLDCRIILKTIPAVIFAIGAK